MAVCFVLNMSFVVFFGVFVLEHNDLKLSGAKLINVVIYND